MTIRIATPQDAPAIGEINAKTWQHAYRGIVPQPYLDSLDGGTWEGPMGQWLEEGKLTAFLAEVDGVPVGCVSCCGARDETYGGWGEIVSLYLLPEHMGRGIGRALLEAGVAFLKEQGFTKAYLWVLRENTPSRRFYQRCGWTATEDQCTVTIGGKDLVDMRYILPSFCQKRG